LKKVSQLRLDTEVHRYVLAIDSSVSRKSYKAFLGMDGVILNSGAYVGWKGSSKNIRKLMNDKFGTNIKLN
jgi:hypothetical protein